MTTLIERLAQRPVAPRPGLTRPYLEYAQRICAEYDLDLALDALEDLLDACDEGADIEEFELHRTILRTLKGK